MAKPLTGSLKKNDKQGIENRPDYRGKYTHTDGSEFWISAWINEDRDTGGKYLSLKFKPKDEQNQSPALSEHNQSKSNGYAPEPKQDLADDDLPF